MKKFEVLATIKEINKAVDLGLDDAVNMLLDCITINNPAWKHHNQFELKLSHKTGHYWVTFND